MNPASCSAHYLELWIAASAVTACFIIGAQLAAYCVMKDVVQRLVRWGVRLAQDAWVRPG